MQKANQVLLHETVKIGANLEKWRELGGGDALIKALDNPAQVLKTVKSAGLRGLGGSGFPTHIKWHAVAANAGNPDKYLICNGNEDEPGTYKDQTLMSQTPHQVIEGAFIAALATGTNKVIFYINPGIAESVSAMETALGQWKNSEFIDLISEKLGTKLDAKIHISSGHYIGGEETAAIESVEGKFPFPRGKPPYPAESGVFNCPTLINNIETLANVPHIVKKGASWHRNLGLGNAVGTKIFSLSGDVINPGVIELPKGTPLSELIFHHGGGMLQGKTLKAVFMGGPSNTILTKNDLDVPLDFDSVKKRRSGLGTGAVIVISEGTGIVKRVAEYVSFFEHSSCGQCPPCKTGTYYISMLLDSIDTGRGSQTELDALSNLCKILPGSGRCHLLDGAIAVVKSSLFHFMDEYKQSLKR
ncbi:MAG: NADH-ubiquinone oxidoreductase-F iron-sulfur binding region domain-containing protein [Thermodesulfobacteriota bacterium]